MYLHVEVMVVRRLTRVKESPAGGELGGGRPGNTSVLVTLPATPIQIIINRSEIGTAIRPCVWTVMIDRAARFSAKEEFVTKAIGAPEQEIVAKDPAIAPKIGKFADR